jgi:hypothetical protein
MYMENLQNDPTEYRYAITDVITLLVVLSTPMPVTTLFIQTGSLQRQNCHSKPPERFPGDKSYFWEVVKY